MTALEQNKRLSVKDITSSGEGVARVAESVVYADDEVGPGKCVTMHFSLAFADDNNEIIDSNFDQSPVSFKVGDGNLLPGFETVLFGFKPGLKKTLRVSSENAFGAVNEDNIQGYPRYQFPADLVMEKGLMISFSDAAGNEQAGVVKEFDVDNVIIDFNHPLAGKDIEFKVEIISVDSEIGDRP